MNVVDSSAWLSYFADERHAQSYAEPISDLDHLLVPSITLIEVFKSVFRQADERSALLAVALALPAGAIAGAAADQEVAYLLEFVASSGCTFIRNGDDHDAANAADHLRLKYNRGKRYADTAENFIDRLAEGDRRIGQAAKAQITQDHGVVWADSPDADNGRRCHCTTVAATICGSLRLHPEEGSHRGKPVSPSPAQGRRSIVLAQRREDDFGELAAKLLDRSAS